jgi:hypothetical protein
MLALCSMKAGLLYILEENEARDDKEQWCVIGIDPAEEPRKWLYLAEGEATYG